jgi:uncharacterized protein YjbK
MVVEQELKLLLKENTYQALLKDAQKIHGKVQQENYYFDTLDLKLEKKGITLRIRQEDDRWLLCLKMKNTQNSQSTHVSSLEFESQVSLEIFNICKRKPSSIITWLPKDGASHLIDMTNDLKLLGSIKNIRYSLQLFKDLNHIFELDHSLFPHGREAFELEIEGIKNEQDTLNIINNIENLGLDYTVNKKSKYKRFVEALLS